MTLPPPTPNRPLKIPAAVAIRASLRFRPPAIRRDTRAAMTLPPALEALRADPAAAAILCDIDGTLAPIVEDPRRAGVPEPTRAVLAGLCGRYRLVARVSGRRAEAAREMVGVEEITYAGNHGLELLGPGDVVPHLDPALGDRAGTAARFV